MCSFRVYRHQRQEKVLSYSDHALARGSFIIIRFSDAQRGVLMSYYNSGMVGVGRQYEDQVSAASFEAGVMIDQVKVSIRTASCSQALYSCGVLY